MKKQFTSTEIGLTTVVDAHPRFWCEFALWALCANRHMACPKRVYFVGDTPPELERFAQRSGIDIRHAPQLLSHSPHCNKLIPFLDPEGFGDQIVTDSDVFATDDFTRFFRSDRVRLPPNNHGVPPLSIFQSIFRELGLEQEPEPGLSIFPGHAQNMETFAHNVSAGVICIPARLRGFAEAWLRQAEWFADNMHLLGHYKGHVDQISFAVAAVREDLPFLHFPAQANAILQLLPHIQNLYALHLTSGHIPKFPAAFDAAQHLKTDGLPEAMHAQIEEFNGLVDEAKTLLTQIPATRHFVANLLNPAYRRGRSI